MNIIGYQDPVPYCDEHDTVCTIAGNGQYKCTKFENTHMLTTPSAMTVMQVDCFIIIYDNFIVLQVRLNHADRFIFVLEYKKFARLFPTITMLQKTPTVDTMNNLLPRLQEQGFTFNVCCRVLTVDDNKWLVTIEKLTIAED